MIEEKRVVSKVEKRKLLRRRIELGLLIVLLSWFCLFLIDYIRAGSGDKPLIVVKEVVHKLDGGKVYDYYSLGYIYREYRIDNKNEEGIVNIFSKPKAVKETKLYPDLNEDFEVYENVFKKEQVDDVLYFYNEEEELIFNYQCMEECRVAKAKDTNVSMGVYDTYVFVEELVDKIVYVIDINQKKIVYKADAVLASVMDIDPDGKEDSKAYGYGSDYIFKKGNKYGVVDVSNRSEIASFAYDSINYNKNSNLYTVFRNHYIVTDAVFDKKIMITDKEVVDSYLIDDNYYIKYVEDGLEQIIDVDANKVGKAYKFIDFYEKWFVGVNDLFKVEIFDVKSNVLNKDKPLGLIVNPFNNEVESYGFDLHEEVVTFKIYNQRGIVTKQFKVGTLPKLDEKKEAE